MKGQALTFGSAKLGQHFFPKVAEGETWNDEDDGDNRFDLIPPAHPHLKVRINIRPDIRLCLIPYGQSITKLLSHWGVCSELCSTFYTGMGKFTFHCLFLVSEELMYF